MREYRVRLLQGTGVEPLFPIWTTAEDTPALARWMLVEGLGAILITPWNGSSPPPPRR